MISNSLKRFFTIAFLICELTNAYSEDEIFKEITLSQLKPLFRINDDSTERKTIFGFEAFNRTFSIVNLPQSESLSPFDKNLKIILLSSNKSIIDQLSINDFPDAAINFIGEVANDPFSQVYGHIDPIFNRFEGIIREENAVYFIDDNTFEKKGSGNISDLLFVYQILDKFPKASFTSVEDVEQMFQQDFIAIDLQHEFKLSSEFHFNFWPRDCQVQVIADYSFYNKVGKNDLLRTVFEIETHFKELNRFLGKNDFDDDGGLDDLQVIISKLLVITDSFELSNYKTSLNPMNYFLTLTNFTFEKSSLIVLFTFMRFEDAKSVFLTNCQHNREKFSFEACGLKIWIISFQGLNGFKISRCMSIARMIYHIGYFLGIDVNSESSDDQKLPSGNAFDSITYSDRERKSIASSVENKKICVPRFITRKWFFNEIINKTKLKIKNYSRWPAKKKVRRQRSENNDRKNNFDTQFGFNEDWWSGPHPWNIFEIEDEKFARRKFPLSSANSFRLYFNRFVCVTILYVSMIWLNNMIVNI